MSTQPSRPKGIDAHYYLVKDLKRAVAFYSELLAVEPSRAFENAVEFDLSDGSTFGLSKPPPTGWQPGGGVMFAVSDIHETASKLRHRQTKLMFDDVIETDVCHVLWCEDSEGNSFAVHQRKAGGQAGS